MLVTNGPQDDPPPPIARFGLSGSDGEAFDMWAQGKNPADYHVDFWAWCPPSSTMPTPTRAMLFPNLGWFWEVAKGRRSVGAAGSESSLRGDVVHRKRNPHARLTRGVQLVQGLNPDPNPCP